MHPANVASWISRAPRDRTGSYAFASTWPSCVDVSPARAAGTLVVAIANRGNKLALVRLADRAAQFDNAQQAGQGWFMRQGHTLARIGWQGDVPLGKAGQRVGADFPVVRKGSQPSEDVDRFVNGARRETQVGHLSP